LLVPETCELLNLRLVGSDHRVTSHARTDGGKSWVRRFVCRVVAVQTIDLHRAVSVQRVRKVYRLLGTVSFARRCSGVRREHRGCRGEDDETWDGDPSAPVSHSVAVRERRFIYSAL